MTKLSEVLGIILKDITQSRITADTLTKEYCELYKKDPLLSLFPIPRVTFKEVNLKLKFAVAEQSQQDGGEPSEAVLGKLWKKELEEKVFSNTIHGALRLREEDSNIIESSRKAVEAENLPKFVIAEALEGKPEKMVNSTVRLLLVSRNRLPMELKKKLPITSFKPELIKRVRHAVDEIIPKLRQLSVAQEVLRMDLDVFVKKSDLEEVQESSIQELTFTLAMEDIQVFEPYEKEEQEED